MPSPVEDRPRYTELIVSSSSPKKLIVAGPGTGKTFTFRQALTAAGGRGLALTFINNLVRDLETELAEVANAYTFHGFCKYLLHRTRVDGLTTRFCYYPPIMFLIAQDMDYLGWSGIDEREIDR
jgi:superfamily I DNA/RNA helicase